MSNPSNPEDVGKQIIDFVKTYYQKYGTPPSARTIKKELKVDLYRYFDGMKELCEKAGVPYKEDDDEKKFEEIAFSVATEVVKKSLEYYTENTLKPMLNSYFERFKLIENELTSVKEKVKPKEAEEKVYELEGSKIKKTIDFSPITLQYYDYYVTKTGDNISLGEFIDNVIDEHFRECLGIEVGVIVRPGGGIRRAR